jgi:precorrin-6B methylase 2
MTKPDYKDANNVEKELLKIFESPNFQELVELKLTDESEWGIKYHLSPIRHNIINWFEFKKNSRILEVGAGCGAVTGGIASNDHHLTSIEPMPDRFDVLKARTEKCKYPNTTVLNIGTNELDNKPNFDYAISIGVLEYSGKFINTKKPFLTFLEQVNQNLKVEGKIILAIENKYGLKYWNGAPEDHVNRPFESVEDYISQYNDNYKGIKTFSKKELTDLLKSAGFSNIDFYYPLPDYKLCSEMFSEKYLPSKNHLISTFTISGHTNPLFNAIRTMKSIIDNDMFEFFANSFLVIADKK